MNLFCCSVFFSNVRAYFPNLFVYEDDLVQETVIKVYKGKLDYEKVRICCISAYFLSKNVTNPFLFSAFLLICLTFEP